jgi:hypothetical protein
MLQYTSDKDRQSPIALRAHCLLAYCSLYQIKLCSLDVCNKVLTLFACNSSHIIELSVKY